LRLYRMSKKQRIWIREEIEDAFAEYLAITRQMDWMQLSVEEKQYLIDKHFEVLLRELKRYAPKRKIDVKTNHLDE